MFHIVSSMNLLFCINICPKCDIDCNTKFDEEIIQLCSSQKIQMFQQILFIRWPLFVGEWREKPTPNGNRVVWCVGEEKAKFFAVAFIQFWACSVSRRRIGTWDREIIWCVIWLVIMLWAEIRYNNLSVMLFPYVTFFLHSFFASCVYFSSITDDFAPSMVKNAPV